METKREEARKKRSRSLSVLSPDLVGGSDLTLQEWGAHEHVGRSKGAIMETLISQGSTLASNSNAQEEFELGKPRTQAQETETEGRHSWTVARFLLFQTFWVDGVWCRC